MNERKMLVIKTKESFPKWIQVDIHST